MELKIGVQELRLSAFHQHLGRALDGSSDPFQLLRDLLELIEREKRLVIVHGPGVGTWGQDRATV